jgi:hypothetical protein
VLPDKNLIIVKLISTVNDYGVPQRQTLAFKNIHTDEVYMVPLDGSLEREHYAHLPLENLGGLIEFVIRSLDRRVAFLVNDIMDLINIVHKRNYDWNNEEVKEDAASKIKE